MTQRAFLLAVLLVVGINLWMLHTELLTGRYTTAGIPPIPAVGVLLLLTLLLPLGQRLLGRRALDRSEVLAVYAFLTVAIPITATYGVRSFLPYLTVLRYYATPENRFAALADALPAWWGPLDAEVIRRLYEGGEGAPVPWSAWLPALMRWSLFWLVLFLTLFVVLMALRQRWNEEERLTFPLVVFPLAVTGVGGVGRSVLQDPLTYLGVGLAGLYNLSNILHAFNPAVPVVPQDIPVGAFFTERPWLPLSTANLTLRPDLIGFAYLVPSDMLLSVWAFYLAHRLLAVLGLSLGYDLPGFPFTQEQSAGGYLMMAVLLLWAGRGSLRAALQALWTGRPQGPDHPFPPRLQPVLAATGLLFLLLWFHAVGLTLPVAILYLATVFAFVLVYARIRAETGIVMEFLYPYGYPLRWLEQVFGVQRLLRWGGPPTLAGLFGLSFLARFHIAEWSGAYQVEGMRLAERASLGRRRMAAWLTAAFSLGLAMALVTHLTAAYRYGQNFLEGQSGLADWRTNVALQGFQELSRSLQHPLGSDPLRTRYLALGALVTGVVFGLRRALLRFPLHPLGYLLANAYGDFSPIWFACLLVWTIKSVTLRLGGIRLYQRLLPLFLGIVIGHFFFAGLVWTTMTVFLDNDIAHRYYTIFG